MPARSAFPLYLLMLAWTLAARVHCQTPEVSLVSTEYVVITWERIQQWYGVEVFDVDISSEGTNDCHKSVPCSTSTCIFNSSDCGLYQPCTATNITVIGDKHTAPPLELVTGPEKVDNVTLWLEEGVLYISWVNPSNDSSTCYEQTAVTVYFDDEGSTDYFVHDIETTSKALCGRGNGVVEVWAEGGSDGSSISSSLSFVYDGDDVVNLVTYESCEPVECTSMKVKWSYTPLCPDVAYINIALYEVSYNVSTDDNSLIVTGLEYDYEYRTCIKAMRKDGKLLDEDCHYYCTTPYVVPQNLTVQPLSDSALRATWKPPVCQPGPQIQYRLRVDWDNYYTEQTSYDVRGLHSFTLYEVKVGVDGYTHYDDSVIASVEEYTKLTAPYVYDADAKQDSIYVYWSFYTSNDYGYEIYYKVTWGNNLSSYAETKEKYYFITDFSDVNEVPTVCVAAAVRGREDLTSETYCSYVEDYSGMEGWAIALIVVGVCLVLVIIIGAVVYMKEKSKAQSKQRRQQHQLQQQQPPQYMYGQANPGASL